MSENNSSQSDKLSSFFFSSRVSLNLFEMVKNMPPSYFAIVMATGIVSIASLFLKFPVIPEFLFWLNIIFYVAGCVFVTLRILFYGRDFLNDLFDHATGPGFFTIVAATCVLGTQFILLDDDYIIAVILWIIGVILWLLITFTIFYNFHH